jgi:uncharacterized protein (TIGR00252 family)
VSTAIGRQAETTAAAFLEARGCRIVDRNWRTRECEIDIIAERDGVMYFCEVKYRASNAYGSGLEYITAAKLRQMRLAARMWVHASNYRGTYRLAAIEVSGPEFRVTAALNDVR